MAETQPSESANGQTEDDREMPSGRESTLVADGTLIEPIYTQAEPSETIDLGKVSATFAHGEKDSPREASVCVRFTPDDRLCFTFHTGPTDMMRAFRDMSDIGKNDGDITLTDRGVKFGAFCVGRNPGSEGGTMLFVPGARVVTATKPSDDITEAVFHLFNFPDFYAPTDYIIKTAVGNQSAQRRCGRLVLKADGWTITIAATDKTADSCKTLKEHGGFYITHMGKIERDDSSQFSSEQLEHVLNCVHSFLSLALGRWAGVALPIGFDKDGNRAFEQWGMPKAASGSWKGSCSWFDAHHGGLLSDLFPTFFERWNNDLWGPAIRVALYWYVAANDRGTGIGVDAGLILAQSALERLAWTYCVLDSDKVSKSKFKKNSAAANLRFLACELGIPLDIPVSTPALKGEFGRKWEDGADAIIHVRNVLVHPDKKNDLAEGSYYDAWKLSLWILDLIFLRLLGHEGDYANRLSQRWVGQVETVPWGKGADSSTADE